MILEQLKIIYVYIYRTELKCCVFCIEERINSTKKEVHDDNTDS